MIECLIKRIGNCILSHNKCMCHSSEMKDMDIMIFSRRIIEAHNVKNHFARSRGCLILHHFSALVSFVFLYKKIITQAYHRCKLYLARPRFNVHVPLLDCLPVCVGILHERECLIECLYRIIGNCILSHNKCMCHSSGMKDMDIIISSCRIIEAHNVNKHFATSRGCSILHHFSALMSFVLLYKNV